MSAILAIYNRDGAPVEGSVVEAMLAASAHRAVDGQDVWRDGAIALGHQRFWITPEEQGEIQPLVDGSGRYVLTCDARLDNRTELLGLLRIGSEEGRQLSDSEFILRAYIRWGMDCAEYLLGDFAFAVWDTRERTLFVCRDSLGARDVCYYGDDRRVLVASEISQILAHPAVEARLNEGKVAEYLADLWYDQEETFFQDIHYCPPAHCLLISQGDLRKWRYWDADPSLRIRYKTDEEYADHYLELLTEAVRCRLRSIGPVGISLSGGLDSTALAALAATLLPQSGIRQKRLKSYSYVFDELTSCDEREYIQPVVDRYDLEATYIPCDDKWTLRDLPRWPMERDYIWSDAYAWLPQGVRDEAQADGCRALIGGYYGDTLFDGGRFWALGMASGHRFGLLARTLFRDWRRIDWREDAFERGLRQLTPESWRRRYRRSRPRHAAPPAVGLHPDFVWRTGLEERERETELPPGDDRVWRHRYRTLMLSVFAQGAAAVRPVYSRQRMELLQPYWDRRLVEFILAVPEDQLARPGCERWLHRNAMRGLLPEFVRERVGKTTFLPLMERGLLERERGVLESTLGNSQLVGRGIVDGEWLRGRLPLETLAAPDARFLWLCLSVELWLRAFW